MHGGHLAIWETAEIKQDVINVDQALPFGANYKQGSFMVCFFLKKYASLACDSVYLNGNCFENTFSLFWSKYECRILKNESNST